MLTLPVCPAQAQAFVWTPGLQQVQEDLQKLNVRPSLRHLAAEAAINGPVGAGIRIFLDDYADMLTLVTTDDERAFARLNNREDERLGVLNQLDSNSPWQRVMLAEVRLHWAFIKLKFGREMGASWDVIRAYKLLAENQKRFPDFLPTYKSLGTLHVMIGSVPDSYGWVANLLGLHGSVRQGQRELERAQHDPTFGLEARLIDLLVRAYVVRFTDADSRTLQQLIGENPDNLLLHFFGATIEQKNGHGERALAYLTSRPHANPSAGLEYLPMPIVDNILGDIYLQKGQYATATTCFSQFLAIYKGRNFLKDTYYKLFLCHWLATDPSVRIPDNKAQSYLENVLRVGRTTVESDKVAQQFAQSYLKRGVSPNQKVLMRARLASDGGFTDRALASLQSYTEASFASITEKAEYNYRMGRIYQHRSEPDAAIPYLSRALTLSEPDQLSFGATAALQLGYIYSQKNDRSRARSFFEKALSFKHHEYKNSVDNKARAGLSGL